MAALGENAPQLLTEEDRQGIIILATGNPTTGSPVESVEALVQADGRQGDLGQVTGEMQASGHTHDEVANPPPYSFPGTELPGGAGTEAEAVENGHIQLMVADEVDLHDPKGVMDNYDVPAHVLAFVPPDGGCRAWIVMFASFLCNGIIFGTINASGLIYDNLVKQLEADGVSNPATKTCKC